MSTSRRRRKLFEASAWILSAALLWTIDTMSKIAERNQSGIRFDHFKLITEQVTSAAAALIMVLFVVHWLRLFPLRKDRILQTIAGHAAGSAIFAFGHYSLMVLFRGIVYELSGLSYVWREPFVANLIVEYQKDIKIYASIVIVITLYQYYRRAHEKVPASPKTGRLVVQTGHGESILRYEQIDYLGSARNYVVIYANDREYLVRETLGSLEKRFADGPFARTHRSFIVNVDKIDEIRMVHSKYQIRLKNGSEVPLSRGYRRSFKSHLAG